MRLNLDANILRRMTDGVVVLNRQAKVVSFNRLGEPWLEHCKLMEPAIRRLIEEERNGRLQLPIDLRGLKARNEAGQAESLQAWLCKNGPSEYAVFLVGPGNARLDDTAQESPRNTFAAMALLGGEVAPALRKLNQHLIDLRKDGGGVADSTLQQIELVLVLLKDVADLGSIAGKDEVFADERLDLLDILAHVVAGLNPAKGPQPIRLLNDAPSLAPVYGNAAWLGFALRILIQMLLLGSGYRCGVDVAVKPLGSFVVVSGHVANPLVHGGLLGSANGETPQSVQASAVLRELLCRRIIELHGGRLKLHPVAGTTASPDGPAAVESFTLTLLTGAPESDRSRASCVGCRHIQQELVYAADLAQLLGGTTQFTSGDRHHAQDSHC